MIILGQVATAAPTVSNTMGETYSKSLSNGISFLDTLPVAAQTGMNWAIQTGFAIVGTFVVVAILRFLLMRTAD